MIGADAEAVDADLSDELQRRECQVTGSAASSRKLNRCGLERALSTSCAGSEIGLVARHRKRPTCLPLQARRRVRLAIDPVAGATRRLLFATPGHFQGTADAEEDERHGHRRWIFAHSATTGHSCTVSTRWPARLD